MSWWSCTSTTCLPGAARSTRPTYKTPLERDRRRKEHGVEGRAGESLANVRARRDHEQWPTVRLELLQSIAALTRSHPTTQHDWIVSGGPHQVREQRDMRSPLGQEQAVPPAGERGRNVGEHLLVAGVVSDEVAVDGGDPARSRRVRVAAIDEIGSGGR